jgi:signal transduction histidine kinase
LPRDAATAIFRIFQEALTNVTRHAQATTAHITLATDPENVTLQVEDNGVGIRPEAVVESRSLGLLGMRERASVLGGEVSFTPLTPKGTRVTLRLPRQANDTAFWADL